MAKPVTSTTEPATSISDLDGPGTRTTMAADLGLYRSTIKMLVEQLLPARTVPEPIRFVAIDKDRLLTQYSRERA